MSRSSAAKSSAPASFGLRVRALANWRMLASARWSGACPRSCSYCPARASVALVICARREENWAIAFSGTPAITRPFDAGRYAHSNPNRRVSPVSSANAASADPPPFSRYRPRESIARHWPSRIVLTLFSHSTCTCSCGSPLRLVCCGNIATGISPASSNRPASTPPIRRP